MTPREFGRFQSISRLADLLAPEGTLLVGHAETLVGMSDEFHPIMPTVYRKLLPTVGA